MLVAHLLNEKSREQLVKRRVSRYMVPGAIDEDGWLRLAGWRRAVEQARPRWGSEAVDTWAREEVGAARCLVYLRHAGLDPTQERDGKEATEERD